MCTFSVKSQTKKRACFYVFVLLLCCPLLGIAESNTDLDYEQARWHPLHFKPAIETAKNEHCLTCHQEILQRQVKQHSPAGLKTKETLAWYQTLNSYVGEQDTFHRRHLVTPLARRLMNLQCNTCHQGHDPREEAPPFSLSNNNAFTLGKTVNPETTCLKCHGQFNNKIMGLPDSWPQIRDIFSHNCLLCHATIRTNRHQVNYLNPNAIEKAGQKNSDICYGCHGGRAWYQISYPYTTSRRQP